MLSNIKIIIKKKKRRRKKTPINEALKTRDQLSLVTLLQRFTPRERDREREPLPPSLFSREDRKKKKRKRKTTPRADNVNATTKSACYHSRVHEHKFLIGLSCRASLDFLASSLRTSRGMQISCAKLGLSGA